MISTSICLLSNSILPDHDQIVFLFPKQISNERFCSSKYWPVHNPSCQIDEASNWQILEKKIIKIVKGVHGNRKQIVKKCNRHFKY